jgi:DNA-binding MarR family transcriptional regulator
MRLERKRFTVRVLKEPKQKSTETDLQWLFQSLGFGGSRDKEKTAFHIFHLLVLAAKNNKGLTSDEIADEVKPTRGAVVHHLNKFMRAGLVVKVHHGYELRMGSLKRTIGEVELDAQRAFERMLTIAEEVDKQLQLTAR